MKKMVQAKKSFPNNLFWFFKKIEVKNKEILLIVLLTI